MIVANQGSNKISNVTNENLVASKHISDGFLGRELNLYRAGNVVTMTLTGGGEAVSKTTVVHDVIPIGYRPVDSYSIRQVWTSVWGSLDAKGVLQNQGQTDMGNVTFEIFGSASVEKNAWVQCNATWVTRDSFPMGDVIK